MTRSRLRSSSWLPPFGLQDELAQAADWQSKIVIDAANAYGVSQNELDGLPSSVVNAQALIGSRLVKAFNHSPARALAQDPDVKDGLRVTFLSSDDDGAVVYVIPNRNPVRQAIQPANLCRLLSLEI